MILKTNNLVPIASFLLFLLAVLPQQVGAQISVSTVLVHFDARERPVHNIAVTNASGSPLYVTVSIEKIEQPGEEGSPASPSEDILISPKRFSVPGKSSRTVRLLLRKRPEELEQVYRVVFSPEERGFGESELNFETQGKGAILRILTGMGVLVFVDPPNAKSELSWSRDGGTIRFKNEGNLHTRLINGKACIGESDECQDLRARRVYGGREYEVRVPADATVTYTIREGTSGDYQTITIPPEGSA